MFQTSKLWKLVRFQMLECLLNLKNLKMQLRTMSAHSK